MNNVAIKYRCPIRNALFLSNGIVLDAISYDTRNEQIELAYLKDNNRMTNQTSDAWLIVGMKSNEVQGYIGTRWIPTYINSLNGSRPTNNNDQLDYNSTQPAVMGNSNNMSTNFNYQDKPNNTPALEPQVSLDDLSPMPGFEFNPVPTSYSRVKNVVSNGYRQWKILIGVTEMDAVKHNEIYDGLSAKAKNTAKFKVAVRDDVLLPLDSRKDIAAFYMISNKQAHVTLSSCIRTHGFFTSATSILNSGINVANLPADCKYVKDSNCVIVNKLHTIALNCSGGLFADWIAMVNESLIDIEKSAISDWVFDLLDEHLASIDNVYTVDRHTFNLWGNGLLLEEHIKKQEDDLVKREMYLDALLSVVKRLTNQASCTSYLHLNDIVSDADFNIKDSVVLGGGVSEYIPVVIVNNDSIDLELSNLIKSVDDDWKLLSVNTPNTYKLIKSLYSGTDLEILNGKYDLKNGNISLDLFYFITSNHVLKVLKNDGNKYLITTVV